MTSRDYTWEQRMQAMMLKAVGAGAPASVADAPLRPQPR
jgi:hypothetical protein